MKKLTFEVHTYAPELNKIYSNGTDITALFGGSTLLKLCKDYQHNCKVVRQAVKAKNNLRLYKLIATRPNGTTETRFCNVYTVSDALGQLNKARQYYNVAGTRLEFKRIF